MPHWALRALSAFSSASLRNLDSSASQDRQDGKDDTPPPFLKIYSTQSGLEAGFGRLPDTDTGRKTPQPWLCICEFQQDGFCPYCEYDQTLRVTSSSVETTAALDNSALTFADDPSIHRQPQKLRKIRSNYYQLHHEALDTTSIIAAKPDSIISADSRTPLLNIHMRSKPDYSPLTPERRTPNKLEKRGKRSRSTSLSDSYSTSLSPVPTKFSRSATITSKSFLRTARKEMPGPRPKPLTSSIETDALVSLAWTGETTSTARSLERSLSSYTNSSASPVQEIRQLSTRGEDLRPAIMDRRRSTLQKTRETNSHVKSPTQPWTLAMAIIDDAITDEKLIYELEEMRIKEVQTEPVDLGLELHPFYRSQLFDSYAEYPLQAGETEQENIFPVDSSWTSARQVFLLCRELVRTERRYLASLKCLITNGTCTPPPPSMLPYLPALIMASEALLERMEANPSAQGVSEAFLACEDSIKESFVSWCSVVGQFFDSGERPTLRREAEELTSVSSSGSSGNLKSQRSQPLMTRTDSNLSVVIPEPNKIRKNTKSRPTVRDLAILPTQRVMRYVLLFKELYSLTPTTLSSFFVVHKALQCAETIASMANEAQGHTAFEQSP